MDMFEINISDPKAYSFFKEGYKLCKDGNEKEVIGFSDENRLIPSELVKAAFYYLAVAKYNYEYYKKEESGKYFHRAGHLMKYTNYINQAARAYANAGIALEGSFKISQDIQKLDFAVRSFAQSKNCFYEIGNSDDSEKMYIVEQKTKVAWLRSQGKIGLLPKWLSLKFWQISSNFGTSFKRWSFWVSFFIIIFTFIYEYLYRCKDIDIIIINESSKWHTAISGIYFSIVTFSTLGYGEIVPITQVAQLVVIFNIILGYLLLGLGIGIITRKIKGH